MALIGGWNAEAEGVRILMHNKNACLVPGPRAVENTPPVQNAIPETPNDGGAMSPGDLASPTPDKTEMYVWKVVTESLRSASLHQSNNTVNELPIFSQIQVNAR